MSDDDRTRIVRRTPQPAPPPFFEENPGLSNDDDRTRIMVRRQYPDAESIPLRDEGATKVYQPSQPWTGHEPVGTVGHGMSQNRDAGDQTKPLQRSSPRTEEAPTGDMRSSQTAAPPLPSPAVLGSAEDPVVGWVVIVKGPGRGRSLMLGKGMNQIGRAPGQQVALDFGDEEIYREGHAQITYDPLGRKFYATHGGQRNLTYLNGEPLLQSTELKGGEELTLGGTTLRFVPLCGENFQW